MATLNTSSEGAAITKSYQHVVDSPLATGPAAGSPTYAQWVVYSVAAPLASAFQQDSGKESLLRVQSTGEGELVDLVDEFSDGKIQFAYAKVKDPNTSLPKSVLIAWCGEGVPERTKGYFGSHLSAVSSLLHGYHVQVTARTDNDLTPEGIIRKVADASGSKYSGGTATTMASKPPPPIASKPVFTPTSVGGTGSGFRTLGSRTRAPEPSGATDADGWGADAPPVTRTQLEKVSSAYKPTSVDMRSLASQKPEASRFQPTPRPGPADDVVRGGYQPIGKVDINAIRQQAAASGNSKDDRPTIVKGAYEPVGKVDIAAIRARAQGPGESAPPSAPVVDAEEQPRSLADRSAAFNQSERLTQMPKPVPAKKFGTGASAFGTKAPAPAGFGEKRIESSAPVGIASKTFADEGGKTPAQIWAEKKAREQGNGGGAASPSYRSAAAISPQASGGGGWQSGYSGKKWAAVQISKTGASAGSGGDEGQQDVPDEPDHRGVEAPSVGSIRDRFTSTEPVPPPMDMSSKPNMGGRAVPIPGLPSRPAASQVIPDEEPSRMPTPPAQPPRSPTPPTPPATSGSPIRLVQPVARGPETSEMEPPEERLDPPAMPQTSLSNAVSAQNDLDNEPQLQSDDLARATGETAAATTFGAGAVASANPGAAVGGKRALIQYDYEKAEDNELELREGEYVTNIDMVDEDWWLGENSQGEKGLFPANYVELVEGGEDAGVSAAAPSADNAVAAAATAPPSATKKPTATAQYDYEAVEDNELSFPDGAKITNIEFPDEDWWLGEYNGHQGLFPSNYVELDQ